MAILRWNPTPFGFDVRRNFQTELNRLRSQMLGLLDVASGSPAERAQSGAGVFPLLNLSEDRDNLYVTAELPGVAAEGLELSVEAGNLTLRGERKIEPADQKVNYHRREREAGFFRRVIALPVDIEPDNVVASTKNGVLTVRLPKSAKVKPRRISVATA